MLRKLESWLLGIWYSDSIPPWYLRILSVIFNVLRKARLGLFSVGLKHKNKLSVPVIVVGNLTVGGTGKTPVVEYLIRRLQSENMDVGVISRGYGGHKSKNDVVVLDQSATAGQVGDEAYMLYTQLKVPVAVGRSRIEVGKELLEENPELDVIISDDGLQHYQLERDIEIVVVDGQRGFGNGYQLPAGPLREPVSRVSSADVVMVNGETQCTGIDKVESINFNLQAMEFKKLNSSDTTDLDTFKNKDVQAIAGIGNPKRFYDLLRSFGVNVIENSPGDHGKLSDEFFTQNTSMPILMTEKDAVKYPSVRSDNVWYLPVSLQMEQQDENEFMQKIFSRLKALV